MILARRAIPLVLVLAVTAAAQQAQPVAPEDEFNRAFEEGLAALQAGRFDASIERFQRCIELFPARSASYYNIACAYARAGNVDDAFDWLNRAAEHGFDDIVHMARDTDLDPIRADPRYGAVVERLGERTLQITTVHVAAPEPAGPAAPASPHPIVIVLHPPGETGETLEARLPGIAGALGAVCIFPDGDRRTTSGGRAFTGVQAGVLPSLAETVATGLPVDASRAYLVGVGSAGPLALDVALTAPGRFRGVIVLGGEFEALPPQEQASGAAAAGLGVYIVHGAYDARGSERARAVRDALAAAGVRVCLRQPAEGGSAPADLASAIAEGFRWLTGERAGAEEF